MEFSYPVTIDASTTEDEPTREVVGLCAGRLVKVGVYFPWGCAGLVGVRIIHYEHQLYPTNPDQWFTGNEILIEFECDYAIIQGWNAFKIEGYNEDDFYPHTPVITFNVLPFVGGLPGSIPWIEG